MAIYFIRAGEYGPVKIGVADDVRNRLRELQCANHEKLALIRNFAGDQPVERWLHRHFAAQRVRGEWFWFSDDMLTIDPPKLVPRSAAPNALARWLADNHVTPKAFAEKIGVSGEAVRLYLLGRRMPRPEKMKDIIEATKGDVTANDFVEPRDPQAIAS